LYSLDSRVALAATCILLAVDTCCTLLCMDEQVLLSGHSSIDQLVVNGKTR
jgi:hypothetical protein